MMNGSPWLYTGPAPLVSGAQAAPVHWIALPVVGVLLMVIGGTHGPEATVPVAANSTQ